MTKKDSTTNDNYFSEYNNLQYVKHQLIKNYLNGWFPKLGFWSGRILYLDTHAGRGKHSGGQSGSPVVALQTLRDHTSRDTILARSESIFLFIEHSDGNIEVLEEAIAELGELPERMRVDVSQGDCFGRLRDVLDELDESGSDMAPAFAFVDPYGFKLPSDLMQRLLGAGRVELFVNVMWRELYMGICLAQDSPEGGMARTMTQIFGSEEWKQIDRSAPPREREDRAIDLLTRAYGTRWVTSMRMLDDNRSTRYILAHFTNHDHGRDLMKDCMWKVCPEGGFYARRSDDPSQITLIEPKPDLKPLETWVLDRLRSKPMRWAHLAKLIRSTLWREPHLNSVIRTLRNSNSIIGSEYMGKFLPKNNPLLTLSQTSSS